MAAYQALMAIYLLDTPVIVDALNGRRNRRELFADLLRHGNALTCCTTQALSNAGTAVVSDVRIALAFSPRETLLLLRPELGPRQLRLTHFEEQLQCIYLLRRH